MFNPPAKFVQDGRKVDYTPNAPVGAGSVVLLGTIPMITDTDIAANQLGSAYREGVFDVLKDASVFSAGDPVYWNPTGSSVNGVAGAGAATATSAGNYLLGYATASALTGDYVVRVKLSGAKGQANPRVSVNTVAAAGNAQSNAASLTEGFNWVTGANATAGAVLPIGLPGMGVEVKNDETANAILKIYPQGTNVINNLSGGAAISMAANTSCIFRCYGPAQWFTIPKVPS